MRYFTFNKLVRDKIVESMIQNKQVPTGIRVLSDSEFTKELLKKLGEEVTELQQIDDKEKLLEELVDVIEILNYLKKDLNLSASEISAKIAAKKKTHGGFDNRVFVESVGVLENSEWVAYFKKNEDRYPEILN